jgi:tetratricopeptide (TPR) repeat protein
VGLCIWAHLFRKKWPVFAWGILFFFLTLLPVSNLLLAAGFIKAERVLYIPSIGLLVSISFLLLWVIRNERTKMIGLVLVVLLGVGFSIRTWIRAGDWKSQYTLALATLKTDPDSPRFNTIMGLEMRAQDKRAEALHYFEQAVKSEEKHIPALVNLGTEYKSLGRLQDAATILEKALALDPNTLATYVNLMSVYRDLGAFDKNVIIAEKAVQRYPQSAPIMWNAANAHQLNGNLEKANELRARAKQLDPNIGG